MGEMRREWIALMAVAVPPVLLVAYVGGYFALSEPSTAFRGKDTVRIRFFDSEVVESIYQPAIAVESALTGWNVSSRQLRTRPKSARRS